MSYFEKISPLSVIEVADVVLGWKLRYGTQPCPLHNEKSGKSFSVRKDDELWNCFGKCGKGGDAITLVSEAQNISYGEAAKEVAKHFPKHFVEKKSNSMLDYDAEHLDVFETLTRLADVGTGRLLSNELLIDYLKNSRSFELDTIKKYRFGYISQEDYDNIYTTVIEYLNPEIVTAFKRHVGRLLIPLFNSAGTLVIAFVSRALSKTDKVKYINDNDSELKFGYHKKFYTYGFAQAKRKRPVVIVEGYLDGPSLDQLGINTVAMGDCSLPEPRFRYLAKNFSKLILGLDNDVTGVHRSLELRRKYNEINFDYVLWDKDIKDANDFLKKKVGELRFGDYFEYLENLYNNNWNDVQNNYANRKDFITRIKNSLTEDFASENYFVRVEITKFVARLLKMSDCSSDKEE